MSKRILFIIPPSPVSLKDTPWFLREERHSSEAAVPFNPYMAASILGMVRERIPDATIEVFDAMVMGLSAEEVALRIDNSRPDIIIITLSAYYLNERSERRLAELPYPTIGIICPVSADPREAIDMYGLKTKYFIYTDETEMVVTEAVREFFETGDIRNTKGMVIQNDNGVVYTGDRGYSDMDSYPLPAYDLFPMDKYMALQDKVTQKLPDYKNMAMINTMKGCRFGCDFCTSAHNKYKLRFKSAPVVYKEIEYLHNKYGFKKLEFLDSEFAVDMKDRKEFCRMLADSGMNLSFLIKNRVELLDEELLGVLKRAGCSEIMYGIETADPRLQKESISKNIDLDLAKRNIALTKKYGLKVSIFIIVGLPGEDKAALKKNAQLIFDAKPYRIMCGILFPDVGSPMYDRYKKDGLLLEKDWSYYRKLNKLCFKHDVYRCMDDIARAKLWMMCQYRLRFVFDAALSVKKRIGYLLFFLSGYMYYLLWGLINGNAFGRALKSAAKKHLHFLTSESFREAGLI